MIFLVLFHPHPATPSRGRSLASLPWWEGLREGDKMAFAFIWVIDPLNYEEAALEVPGTRMKSARFGQD
jgi:hypothetical protein